MISDTLPRLLRCPRCGQRPNAITLRCPGCEADFCRHDGYLTAPATDVAGRDTHYTQADYADHLGYRQVARPLLGAAVRQRWLHHWLFDRPLGPVLDLGCGDGRFAYWNHRRATIVGVDAAPLFSREALTTVDLVQGDGRALPFVDGAFEAAYSIDVLEHLDMDGLNGIMAEARRVLAPGGRLFIFTNSREPSTFQPVIEAQRRLTGLMRRRGIGDYAADDLRKGDHVKALTTFEDFVLLAARHGFAVRRRRFWNGIAQGLIDNVIVRAGEYLLLRRSLRPRPASDAPSTSVTASPRQTVSQRRPVALALAGLTVAMQADVLLLGSFRSGPFFALLERQ